MSLEPLFVQISVPRNVPRHEYYKMRDHYQSVSFMQICKQLEGLIPASFEFSGWHQVETDNQWEDTYRLRVDVKR